MCQAIVIDFGAHHVGEQVIGWVGARSLDQAEQALAIARDIGDPALLARALTAWGCVLGHNAQLARPNSAEAIGLARSVNDAWRVSQILGWQAYGADQNIDTATLTRDIDAKRVERRLLGAERTHAPHLVDSEIACGLRRRVMASQLRADDGWNAPNASRHLAVSRYSVRPA